MFFVIFGVFLGGREKSYGGIIEGLFDMEGNVSDINLIMVFPTFASLHLLPIPLLTVPLPITDY